MMFLQNLAEAYKERTTILKQLRLSMDGAGGNRSMLGQMMARKELAGKTEALKLYSSWVYTAANRNANAVACANLTLYAANTGEQSPAGSRFGKSIGTKLQQSKFLDLKKNGPRCKALDTAQSVEVITDHPFLDLMHNINPHKNQLETMQALSLNLDLGGDNYWYIDRSGINGTPNALWTLRQDWVQVVPDCDNFIKGYLYGPPYARQKQAFEVDEIVQFNRVNLTNPYYGYGRVEGAHAAILGYKSMEDYEYSITSNNAIPSTVINYKKGALDAKTRKTLLREWENALRGTHKSGGTFIADQDIEVKPLALSPRDLTFLQGRKWRFDEIITAFGQTGALYDEKANRANIEGAIHLWEKWEITPTLKLAEQKINEKLIPMYDEPRLFVAFDSVVQRDRSEDRADEELYLKHGMPINRILENAGKDPIEGGDVGYIDLNRIEIGTEAVEPDNSENNIKTEIYRRSTASLPVHWGWGRRKTDDVDRARSGGANGPLGKNEKNIEAGMRKVWKEQKPEAVKQAENVEGADFEFMFDDAWSTRTASAVKPGITAATVAGAKQGSNKVGITVTDFIDRPTVQDAISNHSFNFAKTIGKDGADQLKAAMAEGIELGESIPQLKTRIGNIFEDWKDYRGERIARTESARASMLGVEQQWKETGVVSAKVWDASGDACPFCLDMHGKQIGLGESFWTVEGPDQVVEFDGRNIKLAHNYENVQAPPLHPNCRCDMQPVLIEI
jgi:HK97 family phage portal protein